MENELKKFYSFFLTILYQIYKIDYRFDSLSLLRTQICNEYLRCHPNLSVKEVITLYYEGLKLAKEEKIIFCNKDVYQLNLVNLNKSEFQTYRNLALKMVKNFVLE